MWRVLFVFVASCQCFAVPHQHRKVQDILVFERMMGHKLCTDLIQLSKHATNTTHSNTEDREVFEVITDLIKTYVRQYAMFFDTKNQDVGYHLRNRTVDSAQAVPNFHKNPRMLVGVIALLNSDVAGGELDFPRQSVTIIPQCGKIVVFPNHYSFPWLFQPVRLGIMHFMISYFY